jgi:hypothetical protein
LAGQKTYFRVICGYLIDSREKNLPNTLKKASSKFGVKQRLGRLLLKKAAFFKDLVRWARGHLQGDWNLVNREKAPSKRFYCVTTPHANQKGMA